MRRRTLTLSLLSLVSLVVPTTAHALEIPSTKTVLDNGLRVVFHVDHTLPVTVVDVAYDVGSRFEVMKRTGFAHLFEHLMFMGTRRVPTKMYDAWMEAAGGWNNAWTSEDRTNYYDVAPPTALPLLLYMEADRMMDLGPEMTLEKLNAQREVVRNERRQNTENQPYGIAGLREPELLYPESHPYHHPVIGSHADLEAASVADVKEFFATYYVPSNAVLVVAGDFDPGPTMELVKNTFGKIPSKPKPKDPGAPGFSDTTTTLTGTVRETVTDNVQLPRVYMAWQSPRHFGPGDAELDLLSLVLASGKASRLYEALVYDQKIAQSVEAHQSSHTLGSQFEVVVTARPGVSLDKLEAAIDKELEKVRTTPVSEAELLRAKNLMEAGFVSALQSVRERASLLAGYEIDKGTPDYVEKDLDRYRAATTKDVENVAAKYLGKDARVVLRVVPKGAS